MASESPKSLIGRVITSFGLRHKLFLSSLGIGAAIIVAYEVIEPGGEAQAEDAFGEKAVSMCMEKSGFEKNIIHVGNYIGMFHDSGNGAGALALVKPENIKWFYRETGKPTQADILNGIGPSYAVSMRIFGLHQESGGTKAEWLWVDGAKEGEVKISCAIGFKTGHDQQDQSRVFVTENLSEPFSPEIEGTGYRLFANGVVPPGWK